MDVTWTDNSITRLEHKRQKPEKSQLFKCSGCRTKSPQVFRVGFKAYCSATCFMTHKPMELTGDESRLDRIADDLKKSRNSGRKGKTGI